MMNAVKFQENPIYRKEHQKKKTETKNKTENNWQKQYLRIQIPINGTIKIKLIHISHDPNFKDTFFCGCKTFLIKKNDTRTNDVNSFYVNSSLII